MIRRGFWLTAGAVTGVYGYRRVSALGRRLSASLNPASSLNPGNSLKPGKQPSNQATAFKQETPRVPPKPGWPREPAGGPYERPARPTVSPVTYGKAWSCIRLGIPPPQALPSQQTAK